MIQRTPKILTSLIGLVIFTVMLFQTVACQAEQAGLFDCAPHQLGGTSSESQKNGESVPADSSECHAACHVSAILPVQVSSSLESKVLASDAYATANERCPDGPSKAIDHPPQIA